MKGLVGGLILHSMVVLFKRGGFTQLMKDAFAYLRPKLVEISRIQLILEKKNQIYNNKPINKELGFRVLFISSGNSFLYRAANQREQLVLNKVKSDIKFVWDLKLLNCIQDYDIFVFQRVTYSQVLESMINKIHQQGKIAIYEVDDLMFDPDFAKYFKTSEVDLFYYVSSNAEKILKICDCGLTTTEFLAQALKQKLNKVIINRICPCLEQYRISEEAINQKIESERVRLGYFSGTNTHDYDFMETTPALLYIMEKYEHVDLYLRGFITISPRFDRFGSRVKRLPIVSWKKLPYKIAEIDVNLSPLELQSPYCESKTELKYIEAAMLGIPTIASATEAFQFAIRHGENGLLASNTDDWINCFEVLINDEASRKQIGENARQHVKDFYNPHYRGKQLVGNLQQIIDLKGR
jgi:glycosyltransferase involved in cell wall biosynthesis